MIHVGHLADLLGFDAAIQARGGLMDLTTITLSFTEFASVLNTGVHANDPQHISESPCLPSTRTVSPLLPATQFTSPSSTSLQSNVA